MTTNSVITLAEYMARCNAHYYATRDPLGTNGDFITAPEISQIFGEAIGLWLVNEYMRCGQPRAFTLLEMGGGRGTLMADALRAIAQVMPDFVRGMQLFMLESSPLLRSKQQQVLAAYTPTFIGDLNTLPAQPLFVVANEFFDALPINQYRCADGQWKIRTVIDNVTASEWGETDITVAHVPPPIQILESDTWAEFSEASFTIIHTLAAHIATYGGALLAIDYGHAKTAAGDTLQAVKKHAYTNPLQNSGEVDLTAHVDFAVLANAATPLPVTLTTQGEFLHALGGRERLAALCANKDKPTQMALLAGYHRLTTPDAMGELFKALIIQLLAYF